MFERFTSSARATVVRAHEEATRSGHDWIGTEHVMVALAEDDGVAGQVLREAGVTVPRLREAWGQPYSAPGHEDDLDADALRSIGIDLDDVRRSVEEQFGVGALDQNPPATGESRRRGRRGHIPFTTGTKLALQRGLRQALTLGDRRIGSEHLLLGLLEGDGEGVRLLATLGVDRETLRAATVERSRRSA